ncbi:MAG: hypothetical protein WCY29_05880 [Novosphingobium sp.]
MTGKTQASFYLDTETQERLRAAAAARKASMSFIVRDLVMAHLPVVVEVKQGTGHDNDD